MAREPYIDSEFYNSVYIGREIPDGDFARLAARASDTVDKLTLGRVKATVWESFDADTQEAIQLATCAIAEALATLDTASDGGVITTAESASGAYSYSLDAASVKAVLPHAIAAAKAYLFRTGLLFAGVC